MAIYKVHIKTVSGTIGSVSTYTTNTTTLATIAHSAKSDIYEVSTPDNGSRLADTPEEADKLARESVTAFLANLGVVPNFIKE